MRSHQEQLEAVAERAAHEIDRCHEVMIEAVLSGDVEPMRAFLRLHGSRSIRRLMVAADAPPVKFVDTSGGAK
jgi:DNA-binding GntR family transcriptional regulator